MRKDVPNETREQKEMRMFNYYKKELEKLGKKNNSVRFICVEYLCHFPGIDPYKMAAALSADGIKIIYDDSTISAEENKKKERKVKKMTA